MVGGGAVFDDAGQEDRLKCLLPAIPGYVVTPQARGADLTVQPVPNPIDLLLIASQRYVAKQFPASIDHVGYLTGAVATTKIVNDQKLEAAPTLGFKTVYNSAYNPLGETTWTPFAQAIKSAGVKGLVYTGEPENLAKLLLALSEIGYKLDWVTADANHVDSKLIETGGAAVKNVYIAGAVRPLHDGEGEPRHRSSTSSCSTSTCRTASPRPISATRGSRRGSSSRRRPRRVAPSSPGSACTTTR